MKKDPNDPHNDIYTRLTLLVDNELSKEAERELLMEIKSNPDYRDYVEKEKSFRDLIRSKLHRRKASPDLLEALKEKIKIAPNAPFSPQDDENNFGRG